MQFYVLFVFALVFIESVLSASNPDEIYNLPGLSYKIKFRQYSGYLNASNGRYLHYWFVESERNPLKDPLVLWMNGGPGCSSLDGLLSELGPFHVKKDGKTLYENVFAWNKIANVIFLEAPAGVGFSYSKSQNYSTDDDQVANDNYLALQHFFVKFPQYKTNKFYITGESYGGIYVPTLSVKVLTGTAKINFKGFAVGNGFLDRKLLGNSIIFFGYYHGLYGKQLWNELTTYCCDKGNVTQESCHFASPPSANCLVAVGTASAIIGASGLNIYNLYADCQHSSYKHSREYSEKKLISNIFNIRLKSDPPCIDSSNISNWLNQPSVRKALHIPTNVQKWDICSGAVESGYKNIYSTMTGHVKKLINAGKKGLVYNGDVDMACNFLGDQWFADSLQYKVTSEYSEWEFNDQIAGFYKSFGNLTFLTIKGSGHMVPQDKPGPALKMITSFLFKNTY